MTKQQMIQKIEELFGIDSVEYNIICNKNNTNNVVVEETFRNILIKEISTIDDKTQFLEARKKSLVDLLGKTTLKTECDGCIHQDGCGIDEFFWDEIDLSEEERFIRHCVGCCCGDGCECNKNHGCSNYEDDSSNILG